MTGQSQGRSVLPLLGGLNDERLALQTAAPIRHANRIPERHSRCGFCITVDDPLDTRACDPRRRSRRRLPRSEEHTSELQSLMRISYAVFCLKKKKKHTNTYKLHDHITKDKTTDII